MRVGGRLTICKNIFAGVFPCGLVLIREGDNTQRMAFV